MEKEEDLIVQDGSITVGNSSIFNVTFYFGGQEKSLGVPEDQPGFIQFKFNKFKSKINEIDCKFNSHGFYSNSPSEEVLLF